MKRFLSGIFIILTFALQGQQSHDFLHDLYDQLHDSPMQQKFRKLQPMPTGVVYLQRPGEGEEEIRQHFRLMKELGFNSLKQIKGVPPWTIQQIELIALEEGLFPWWYGDGGWEDITPELLKKLGIPVNTSMEELRKNQAMIEYQNNLMRERIRNAEEYLLTDKDPEVLSGRSVAFEPELGARGTDLSEEGKQLFIQWVKDQYQTIENLNHAWNQHHVYLQPDEETPFQSWEDFDQRWQQLNKKEYRHLRDILRFKVEHSLASIQNRIDQFYEFDPHHVFRGGGEMSVFLPQAHMAVDLESIAELMTDYGSFYPSIHFAWHFFPNDYELVRPFYMQSSIANDFFKGGWAATWESTGGPQQFSGGKGGAGFTVDEGVMTQFILSQIAAGFKGFGLWSWSPRTAGWEAGEYALLDRHNQVTPRAIRVGKIAQAMEEYRGELWNARKEPTVGILTDWDNEAIWAVMSEIGRDEFRMDPIYSRIGISRALINANVPFEYVTSRDIKKGLAPRYQVIYLSQNIAISDELLGLLSDYVKQGGRLVADIPFAWFDDYGAMRYSNKGTVIEQIFGTTINDFQYSGVNVHNKIGDFDIEGFLVNQTPSTAKILAHYDTGLPAVTENTFGNGTAILLGYQASKMCFEPGNETAEKMLIDYVLGELSMPYSVDEAIVYRLAAPDADHYFFINDGEAKAVNFTSIFDYQKVTDLVTGAELRLGASISLDKNSGRWLRFEK